MTKLFTPNQINGMTLSNRFVRSATWSGMAADDGACTPQLVDLMVNVAKGGIGLIITGHAYVRQDGRQDHGSSAFIRMILSQAFRTLPKQYTKAAGKSSCNWHMPVSMPDLRSHKFLWHHQT